MPAYHFICRSCGRYTRRLLNTPPGSTPEFRCQYGVGPDDQRDRPRCNGGLKRTPKPPKAFQKEVVDTGLGNMPRRIERFEDIERINHERAHQDHSRPDWQKTRDS